MTFALRESSLDDLYARQVIEPGFDQDLLGEKTLIAFAADFGLDPVASALLTLLTTLGVFRTTLACHEPRRVDLSSAKRAMRLNPRSEVLVVPTRVALRQVETLLEAGSPPYVSVAISTNDYARHPLQRLVNDQPATTPVRYHAVREGGIVLGSNHDAVARRAAGLGPPLAPGLLGGAAVVEAAARIALDYLALSQVWESPRCPGGMPLSPDPIVLPATPAPRTEDAPSGLTLLIVGGGGALAHGFLEALLQDRLARAALRGGRIVIVDPDSYELSNLARQPLAGGLENVHGPKAEVTAASLRERWGADSAAPNIVAVPEPFSAEHAARFDPHVVCLFPDNFAARAEAQKAFWNRRGVLVISAGTSFTYGQVRATVLGEEHRCACFDCGPESLTAAAVAERIRQMHRASCAREITSSNVLTNALAGSIALQVWNRVLSGLGAESAQRLIAWEVPERVVRGPELPACDCRRTRVERVA